MLTVPDGLYKSPEPKLKELYDMLAFAQGANGMLHYRFRQCLFGDEQFHGGILPPDGGRYHRVFQETKEEGDTIMTVGEHVKEEMPRHRIAIGFSYETLYSNISYRYQSIFPYLRFVQNYYTALNQRGYLVDFIDIDDPDTELTDYSWLLLPTLLIADKWQAQRLERFVQDGGHLVCGTWAGIKDDRNQLIPLQRPCYLTDLFGINIYDFDIIPQNETLECFAPCMDETVEGAHCIEHIEAREAETVLTAKDSLGTNHCVGSVNHFGNGKAWYFGTFLTESALNTVLPYILHGEGYEPEIDTESSGVIYHRRPLKDKGMLWFLFNFSEQPKQVNFKTKGVDFLSPDTVLQGRLEIPPRSYRLLKTSDSTSST